MAVDLKLYDVWKLFKTIPKTIPNGPKAFRNDRKTVRTLCIACISVSLHCRDAVTLWSIFTGPRFWFLNLWLLDNWVREFLLETTMLKYKSRLMKTNLFNKCFYTFFSRKTALFFLNVGFKNVSLMMCILACFQNGNVIGLLHIILHQPKELEGTFYLCNSWTDQQQFHWTCCFSWICCFMFHNTLYRLGDKGGW